MIHYRRSKQAIALAFIAMGALLMLLSPSVQLGLLAFALGILLELIGQQIEHHARHREDS